MVSIPMGRMAPEVRRITTGHPSSWREWQYGRLIWMTKHDDEPPTGLQVALLREPLESEGTPKLMPQDVLGIRLYQGCLEPGPPPPRRMLPRADYDETMALLAAIGPPLRGVVVGNQGYELSYRHFHGNWDGDWKGNLADCREFMLRAGGLLREMGIQPFFALMDWDILQDAYRGNGMLLDTLNDLDAINYIACGYACTPGAWVKPHERQCGDQMRWQSREMGRGWRMNESGEELPVLRDYLHRGRFWSGLSGPKGILAGNIAVMYEFGFSGFATGVAGGSLAPVHEIMESAALGRID